MRSTPAERTVCRTASRRASARARKASRTVRLLVSTNSRAVRALYADEARRRREAFAQLTRAAGADLVEVSTDGSHLDALIRFFRLRARRLRRT